MVLLLLAALASPSAAGASTSGEAVPVRIFAATAVCPAIEKIGAAFTKKTGTPVQVTAGGSAALSRQILEGADADLFVSEGSGALLPLLRVGIVTEDSSFPFATNSLVVAAPAALAIPLASPEEMTQEKFRRLSILDPDAMNAGHQAKRSLTALGLWEKLRGRLLVSPDLKTALSAVEAGKAELGIFYLTDVVGNDGVKVVFTLPPSSFMPIRYALVLVAHPGGSPAARPLCEFLRGDEARRILAASGLIPAFP